MLFRWLTGLLGRGARRARPPAAVYVSHSALVSARAVPVADGHRVDMCVNTFTEPGEASGRLREQSRRLGLGGSVCNLVLAPELYNLSLLERPPVPDAELKEAMRWRIQDSLDYPADQAALDVFTLPASASRDRSMVFVAAIRQEHLKRHVDQLHAADMVVASVDIAELALRNVVHGLYPEADKSMGLLRLTASSGIMNLSRGEELFLSRRISGVPGAFTDAAWAEFRDRLVVQVQRSIDYYESAMSQPPCSALLVAITEGWQAPVCEYLGEMLPVPIRCIADELGELFRIRLFDPEPADLAWGNLEPAQSDALSTALPALGGLMRVMHEQGLGARPGPMPDSAVIAGPGPSREAA